MKTTAYNIELDKSGVSFIIRRRAKALIYVVLDINVFITGISHGGSFVYTIRARIAE